MPSDEAACRPPRALLLDIDGVICVGREALPGSVAAVQRLRRLGVPLRFVTNTTRRPRRRVLADLRRLGIDVEADEIFTPACIGRDLLAARDLTPLLVVHPDLVEDFEGLAPRGAPAVVIGDAGDHFNYETLNRAFRAIVSGASFFALAKNRYFRDRDGKLSLDAGPFVAGLEYASGEDAIILGKPSGDFFQIVLESLRLPAGEVTMIGDDVEADVGGALAAGLDGVLVRTGKYRPGLELEGPAPPTAIDDDLSGAVERLFG